ncbi:DEAD/DEAH box helicase [Salipiger sp.]|uniref:DEAD/DEAH box helicase n=1 Tax=Salipiger sp. TaxID=2078585 RepID=UPI003A97D29B
MITDRTSYSLELLKAVSRDESDWKEILGQAAKLSNDPGGNDQAREIIIRILDKRAELPDKFNPLLDSLIKTTGLIPYLLEVRDFEDAMLVGAHEAPGLKDKRFHTLQLNVYEQLMAGRNVVLSATTSVGKSMVIDAVAASKKFSKIVIIVPTIALIDETRRRLTKQFGHEYDVITHTSQKAQPSRKSIFILTQERVLSRTDLDGLDFFVVDEFYKLDIRSDLAGGRDRSVDLNLAFHKLASGGAQFYLIGPHVDVVRGIAGRYQHVFIPSKFATVALDVEYFGLPKFGDERVEKVADLLSKLSGPTLVYCQSPSKCAEVASFLIQKNIATYTTQTKDAVSWLENEYPSGWVLTEALKHGIGIHHGNVPRSMQQYMIRAFSEGTLSAILCTSTLIEGVNTVAENVIVYDRRVSTSNIDYFSFRNVAGRAGRMGEWFVGKVFVLEEPPEAVDMIVDIAVDTQPEDTPISLLLGLPDDKLTPLSKARLELEVDTGGLDTSTVRANRHVEVDVQARVAKKIANDMVYMNLLNWSHLPKQEELIATCEIIHSQMDFSNILTGYQIFDGEQLAAVLTRIRLSENVKDFLVSRVAGKRPEHSESDAIEIGLRFLRSFVGFTLPRQMSAIQRIHRDVCRKAGVKSVADYSYFASLSESMFLDPNVFSLDEFGLPFSLSRKLLKGRDWDEPLQDAVDAILTADLSGFEIHPFEMNILDGVLEYLPRSGPKA